MTKYFDIYGFVIKVEGPAIASFYREYHRFEIKRPKKPNMEVIPVNEIDRPFVISPIGSEKGIFIDFENKKIFYQHGISGDFVLYHIEPLLQWPNKILVHAGAVEKDGHAILFPAAGGVGKTSIVMSLSKKGFRYLGDDWVIMGADGKAFPFFKTMHIFDYNLSDIKLSKKVLGKKYFMYKIYFGIINFFLQNIENRNIRFVLNKLKGDFKVDVKRVFDENLGKTSEIKTVFWLKSDNRISKPTIKKANREELSKQISYVISYEHNHFFKDYLRYAYFYGSIKNIEEMASKTQRILRTALRKADVYEVQVPKKINSEEVYDLIQKFIS